MRDTEVVREEALFVKRMVDERDRAGDGHDEELHDLLVAAYPSKASQDQ